MGAPEVEAGRHDPRLVLRHQGRVLRIRFAGELFLHDEGSWYFVAVPLDLSDELRAETDHVRRGFGSLRVQATIGTTTWDTSVFPSSSGPYVLPVKKQVRRDEGLEDGAVVNVTLRLLDL